MIASVAIGVTAAATAYFIVRSIQLHTEKRSLTFTESAQQQIDDARRKATKPKPKERIRLFLAARGYTGDPAPLILGLGILYIIAAIGLRVIGVTGWIGVGIALPTAVGIATGVSNTIAGRKRRKFRRQLASMLSMLAAKVEASTGPQRALEQIVGDIDEPLGGEFRRALSAAVASKDLIGEMRALGERYPSRSFELFVAALEINDRKAGSLAPALRQASLSLQREFELTEETLAEISQTKGEFYAIVAIIGFVAVSMWFSSDESTRSVYFSPVGLAVLGAFGGNFAFGIFRALRVIDRAKGNV